MSRNKDNSTVVYFSPLLSWVTCCWVDLGNFFFFLPGCNLVRAQSSCTCTGSRLQQQPVNTTNFGGCISSPFLFSFLTYKEGSWAATKIRKKGKLKELVFVSVWSLLNSNYSPQNDKLNKQLSDWNIIKVTTLNTAPILMACVAP